MANTTEQVIQYFDAYYDTPVDLDASAVDMVSGFFESRGFDPVAAKNITYQILIASKQGNYDYNQIIDALRGYDKLQLNDFLLSVLNFNRNKSSSLGNIVSQTTAQHIKRNIIV